MYRKYKHRFPFTHGLEPADSSSTLPAVSNDGAQKGRHMCSNDRLVLSFWLLMVVGSCFSTVAPALPKLNAKVSTAVAAETLETQDPNKGPSEFNHHVAGYALIGVSALVIAGLLSSDLRASRFVWPFLFILAGVFLASWSDAEIWPRGNLNWAWLLHHDREARQHKIYALLLIAIGVVEWLRARGSLPRFCRIWLFPILAVAGAGLLLIHDHASDNSAHSLAARAYLVNPALDCDGKPWHTMNHQSVDSHVEAAASSPSHASMDHSTMNADQSMLGHSTMAMDESPVQPPGSVHHHETPVMLIVKREHFWFFIVGLAVALFKFISDADLWRQRFIVYLWPTALVVLGVLLTLYHE